MCENPAADRMESPRKKTLAASKEKETTHGNAAALSSVAVDLEDPYSGRNDAVYELFILLFIYVLGEFSGLGLCADSALYLRVG